MRVIVAGSRDIPEERLNNMLSASVAAWLDQVGPISVVLSGTARGADRAGERWAEANGVPVERYPALWAAEGKRAGIIRNCEMASKADGLIALWDGESKGTKHMIDEAQRRGLKVMVSTWEAL